MKQRPATISTSTAHMLYFLIDTNVLVNKYLNPSTIKDVTEKARVQACKEWWKEIQVLLKKSKARVYVLDLTIAEAFKVLAKKYYGGKVFSTTAAHKQARDRLRKDIHLPLNVARAWKRRIGFHDVSTNRDIIISVDRFFEKMHKLKLKNIGIVDLLILASAKYLLDFYGIKQEEMFIVTMDKAMWSLARSLQDLPRTFNPTLEPASKVFKA